jgi:hypothetical protein
MAVSRPKIKLIQPGVHVGYGRFLSSDFAILERYDSLTEAVESDHLLSGWVRRLQKLMGNCQQ